MAGEGETRLMLGKLFEAAGLEVTEKDLAILHDLHQSFAGQRSRLTGAARPETEPMIVPAFDRAGYETEPPDEQTG